MSTPPPPAAPPLRARWKKIAGTLGLFLAGGVVGVAGASLLDGSALTALFRELRGQYGRGGAVALMLGMLALTFWLAVALHELGHVAGGVLARFHFLLYTAGPLRIERDGFEAPLRLGLNREINVLGGMAVLVPTEYHALRQRLAVLIAGGPLANLLVAGLAWLGFGLAGPALLKLALGTLAVLSGFLFLVASVPSRAGGLVSDGARLLRLLRHDAESRREAAMFPLLGMMMAGAPPRSWPAELVGAALQPTNGSFEECQAALLAFYHALDAGDVAAAGRHVDCALALIGTCPPGVRPAFYVEAAFYEALYRRDAERAKEHLARVPAKTFVVKPYERHRAEAALALAEGERAAARLHLERASHDLPRHGAFTRSQLAVMERMLDADAAPLDRAMQA